MAPEIIFPNLNIVINHLSRVCFEIGNFPVYWYGVIMTCAIICGVLYAAAEAKRTGHNPEIIYDFLAVGLVSAIICARAYYVAFSWDDYKDNLIKIFAIREGGIAVYGSIIGGLIALVVFTKVKKLNLPEFMDIIVPGLALGQAIGRYGNFFNREAFGGFTDNIFALCYLKETVSNIPRELLNKTVIINGGEYIQVHPTFLYESLWNLGVFTILLLLRDKKKYNGQLAAMYFFLYGCGRAWIEGLRCDQLLIGNTGIAVSQVLSVIIVILSATFMIIKRKKVLRGE